MRDPRCSTSSASDDAHRLRAIPLDVPRAAHRDRGRDGRSRPTRRRSPRSRAARRQDRRRTSCPSCAPSTTSRSCSGCRGARASSAPARPGTDGEDPPEPERRRSQPAAGMVMPPRFTLAAARAPRLADAGDRVGADRSSRTAPRASGSTPPPHRDQIADAFVDYAKGRCDALVLFLIRDGNALGWRGWIARPATIPTADRGDLAAARRRLRAAGRARRGPAVRRTAAVDGAPGRDRAVEGARDACPSRPA